jgi:hypothetical protein
MQLIYHKYKSTDSFLQKEVTMAVGQSGYIAHDLNRWLSQKIFKLTHYRYNFNFFTRSTQLVKMLCHAASCIYRVLKA